MRLLTRGEWFVTAALHRFLVRMFDTVWLILCDRLILETDPATIASRVSMRGAESDIPLTDRVTEVRPHNISFVLNWKSDCCSALLTCPPVLQVNIQSFLATAKEQLARSLLK